MARPNRGAGSAGPKANPNRPGSKTSTSKTSTSKKSK